MTDATSVAADPVRTTGGAFYRLVWKWHFLASLYVLPFMAMLALTGGLYLYKPQIEGWLYADYTTTLPLETSVGAVSLEDQAAALDPQRIRGITVYDDPTATTKIEFNAQDGTRSYGWVDPYTGEVLGTVARDTMPMRLVQKFHGELLLRDVGTLFVELAAHWAIVMFVTGAYLWWPRGNRTLRKAVSLPQGRGRNWWKETHLFMGFLSVLLVVPILVTGLPWTNVWGGGLDRVQEATGQSSKSYRWGGGAPKSTAEDGTPIAYAQVIAIAQAEGLAAPWEMRPAKPGNGSYWVRSASDIRAEQSELVIDQYTGDVLARIDFADNPALAQAVSYGISFHRGEAYGWLNVAQNTLAALLAFGLSVTGFVAWWMRRPSGQLGVPPAPEASLGTGMILLVIGLALLFPLMGASLVAALLLDWLLFRRLGWFRTGSVAAE